MKRYTQPMAEMVSLHTSDVITSSPSGYTIANEGYGESLGDYSGFLGNDG